MISTRVRGVSVSGGQDSDKDAQAHDDQDIFANLSLIIAQMVAAITESLTFNPTHMVFTLNVEHWIFGWTSSPHNCAFWKYLSFSLCPFTGIIGKFTFVILGKAGSVTKPFLAQLKLWPVLFWITLHVVTGAPGVTWNTKYPMMCLFVFILELLLILNKEKRIPICLIEASFPGKN